MKKKNLLFVIIALLIVNCLIFYFTLPVISIHNKGLWIIVLLNVILILLIKAIHDGYRTIVINDRKLKKSYFIIAGIILVIIIGDIGSSRMLNAKAYTRILDITVSDEVELPTEKDLARIPLMDTESSKVLGNRKIGSLNEIVSQFEVSNDYITVAYHDIPVKVAPLEYADFWKWNANKGQGIPGYVIVDPNKLSAEYVKLDGGMKYVPSAFLSQDLDRYIYFHYPTVFFDEPHFEIDESGKPFYVATTYKYDIFLFGGKTITGAIIVDPADGSIARYDKDNLPEWVDVVYNGNYVAGYFDIYGRLINGFWNSLFGQKGLIESTTTTIYYNDGTSSRTNDFGYIVRDNDVYIYTGVTAVTNDESNIGYLLANERTGKIVVSYFESTDEDSVMRAAEGEVQEKGYRASFPSLVSINGKPAYVMVLKDNLGLVKMYAIVDANQYSHMEVDDSLERAISLFTRGQGSSVIDQQEMTITIKKVELVTIEGNTYVYLVDTDNNIYYGVFDARALLLEAGDSVTILSDGEMFMFKE